MPFQHPQQPDPQSVAYRDATAADFWDGDLSALVAEHGATYHPPITALEQIQLPEVYEADDWDCDREAPKTREQARTALLERIRDPAAPDIEAHADAYDGLGDSP